MRLRPKVYVPLAAAALNAFRGPKRRRLRNALIGAAIGYGAAAILGESRLPTIALPMGS